MTPDAAYDLVRHAFATSRPASAYILGGAASTTGALADRLLQALFCTDANRPCGACRGCRLAAEHTHADVLWVEPEKKSRRIGIEQVRSLQGMVYQTSFEGGWRVCVISGADRLGEQAANAFLKTLEEPPARCVFLLLSDSPQSLLPTIASRCQRLAIEGAEDELPAELRGGLVEILKGRASHGAAFAIAQADAMMRLLDTLKDQVGDEYKERAADADEDKDTREARIGALFKERQAAVLRFAMLWQRDLLLILSGCDDVVYHHASLEALRERARGLSVRQAIRNVQVIEELARRLDRNVSNAAMFTAAFARLA